MLIKSTPISLIRHITLILLLFIGIKAHAVPANPVPYTIVQPDGTSLVVTQMGDEIFSYHVTQDKVMLKEVDGAFYYYTSDANKLILAHEKNNRSQEEVSEINKVDYERNKRRWPRRLLHR